MSQKKHATHNIVRVLSKLGYSSRKQAVELVKAGRVSVNGRIVAHPGEKVSFSENIIVDGKKVAKKEKIYILLNKPSGYVTTRSDEKERDTVYEFIKDIKGWVAPVGRLDKDSEGLLIFTNDTVFSDKMTDPKSKVPRTYEVLVDGRLSAEEFEKIKRGTDIGRGEASKPLSVKKLKEIPEGEIIEIVLTEGKNREIRRLLEVYGKKILRLKRVAFGRFSLGDIKPGKYKVIDIR